MNKLVYRICRQCQPRGLVARCQTAHTHGECKCRNRISHSSEQPQILQLAPSLLYRHYGYRHLDRPVLQDLRLRARRTRIAAAVYGGPYIEAATVIAGRVSALASACGWTAGGHAKSPQKRGLFSFIEPRAVPVPMMARLPGSLRSEKVSCAPALPGV